MGSNGNKANRPIVDLNMSVKSPVVTRAKDLESTDSQSNGSLEPLARNKAIAIMKVPLLAKQDLKKMHCHF
jgi:hypothetical protein